VGDRQLPKVSIVLPCFNEAGELSSVIENLEQQTFADREVIIVDDGSADGSAEIAKEVIDRNGYVDARIVLAEHGGPAHARNVGVRESVGPVVFFAECDCVYAPEYVSRAFSALERNPMAGAVCLTGAPLVIKSTAATESVVIENRLQHKLLGQGKLKPFYAWVFRRDVLLSLGGYDETLTQAEDRDLFGRLKAAGYEVAWVPGIHWWHKRSQSLGDIARTSFSRSETRASYVVKHHASSDVAKAVIPVWSFVIGILLLPINLYAGLLIALLVISALAFRAAGVIRDAWDVVEKRKWFAIYPFFVLVRNFSSGLGYTLGLLRLAFSRPSSARGEVSVSHDRETGP
jgi:glycosyltransferase involved in cell wall biosynthesis